MSHVQMSAFKCLIVSEYIFKQFPEILWKFICLKNTFFRDSINTSVAFFWLITNSALVEVECELRKYFAFPMLLIPFGKIKESKERVIWFFLNTS